MITREGHVKGTVLVHMRAFIVQKNGEGAWHALLDALGPEDRATLAQIVLVGGWYPVRAWNHAMNVYLPKQFPIPGKGMVELAKYIAEKDLGMLFKMLLKVGSPGFLMARTPSIWSRYFDTGSLTSEELAKGKWKLFLDAPIRMEEAPNAFTCSEGVCAWIKQGLELTGTRADVVQTACRFRGASRCEYTAMW
jgi:hypothetical protein